ncbi:MAG: hypothetical protein SP1CHLAM54_00850 [Chlamydiia bacterium]|nr:hypothetical protein [Chlamydiia bacterium]MCH9615007.1 hypothetical protein [Chlamydiia bacterium]MCH9629943.1 hypothetical protein [Chlamydiia bacterium]
MAFTPVASSTASTVRPPIDRPRPAPISTTETQVQAAVASVFSPTARTNLNHVFSPTFARPPVASAPPKG